MEETEGREEREEREGRGLNEGGKYGRGRMVCWKSRNGAGLQQWKVNWYLFLHIL